MPRLTRRQQQQQSRRALLDSAAQEFARHGFHGATVVDIAENAGFTRGGFYSNFASKEEIFLDLYRTRTDQRIDELTEIANSPKASSGIRAAAAQWTATVTDDPGWVLLLVEFWAHAARTPGVREEFTAIGRRFAERLTDLIATQAARAACNLPVPADALSAAVIGMGVGIALQDLADPARATADLLERVLLLTVRGMRDPQTARH